MLDNYQTLVLSKATYGIGGVKDVGKGCYGLKLWAALWAMRSTLDKLYQLIYFLFDVKGSMVEQRIYMACHSRLFTFVISWKTRFHSHIVWINFIQVSNCHKFWSPTKMILQLVDYLRLHIYFELQEPNKKLGLLNSVWCGLSWVWLMLTICMMYPYFFSKVLCWFSWYTNHYFIKFQ
jgi:hypothetical protein